MVEFNSFKYARTCDQKWYDLADMMVAPKGCNIMKHIGTHQSILQGVGPE